MEHHHKAVLSEMLDFLVFRKADDDAGSASLPVQNEP